MTSTAENSKSPGETRQKRPVFVTTQWSAVLRAGNSDTTRAREALSQLCQKYWFPLYAHVRRGGHSTHDAQDLTQAFFAQLLERQALALADPSRGTFRTFLLSSLNQFLINDWQMLKAQKRGGRHEILSLDLAAAEERYDLQPVTADTPDQAFDKQWALSLLDRVLNQLEDEHQRSGRHTLFQKLKRTLAGSRESQPYRELAEELQMSEAAVKVAVHRLRSRYRELLLNEIAGTLANPADAKQELNYLFQILSGN